jgi:hypothetical protein
VSRPHAGVWTLQGLGITLFGMAYMFVHDGLVHRRFPVGPIANVPYFRRVAAAHQVRSGDHHSTFVPEIYQPNSSGS